MRISQQNPQHIKCNKKSNVLENSKTGDKIICRKEHAKYPVPISVFLFQYKNDCAYSEKGNFQQQTVLTCSMLS